MYGVVNMRIGVCIGREYVCFYAAIHPPHTHSPLVSSYKTGTSQQPAAQETLLATLQREATMCQELLDMEPDAKWPMLTKARILRALGEWSGDADGASLEAGAQELYTALQEVDPARKGYYADEVEGRCCVLLRAAPFWGRGAGS